LRGSQVVDGYYTTNRAVGLEKRYENIYIFARTSFAWKEILK
jgi:hypothetical protein